MRQVDEFTYLESVITSDGKFVQDIEKSKAGAMRAFGMLLWRLLVRREINLKVNMKIYVGV